MEFATPERTVATIQDPVDTLLEENDRALWEIVNGDHEYGNVDELQSILFNVIKFLLRFN